MNLCENIQIYRKRLDISQEELGKMLFVSRQTISMWEKGQTVPTVDNLVRLAEIFSITVDELLKGESDTRIIKSSEMYELSFSKEEIKEIQNYQNTLVYQKPLKFFFAMILLLLIAILTEIPDIVLGYVLGMFLTGMVSNIKGIVAYKKLWKNNSSRISESTYKYDVFEDSIEIEISRSGVKRKSYSVRFVDIEIVQQLKNHYLLQVGNELFIIRKSDLKANSLLYSYLGNNNFKIKDQPIPNRWRMTSIGLFVLSICSILFALFLFGNLSERNNMLTENTWLFFTMTPIPVSSVIFGIVAKHNGYNFKKNIVVGIIMTVLLCIYGSFVFIF